MKKFQVAINNGGVCVMFAVNVKLEVQKNKDEVVYDIVSQYDGCTCLGWFPKSGIRKIHRTGNFATIFVGPQ